jgi:hypothetical protein
VRHNLGGFPAEAEMRPVAAVIVYLVALSLPTAPNSRNAMPVSLGLAPVVELVAEGCSLGWQRGHWQDASGAWHWSQCFPIWL